MYAKVFAQVLDSSLAEDYEARHVFIDLLLLADQDGIVDMTHDAIARRTNAPRDVIVSAIKKLSAPDPESRTPDADGRRIVLLDAHRDWGWRIVNYSVFRDIRNREDRKAYMRGYMRQRRSEEPVGEVAAAEEESAISSADMKSLDKLATRVYGQTPTGNLMEALENYDFAWVKTAMLKTEAAGKRKWAYTKAILVSWAKQKHMDRSVGDGPQSPEEKAEQEAYDNIGKGDE